VRDELAVVGERFNTIPGRCDVSVDCRCHRKLAEIHQILKFLQLT
jgi:hypothetical protein